MIKLNLKTYRIWMLLSVKQLNFSWSYLLALFRLSIVINPSLTFQDDVTPLDQYVHAPDDVYRWEEIDYYNLTEIGCHTYIVNFTSQTWQTRMMTRIFQELISLCTKRSSLSCIYSITWKSSSQPCYRSVINNLVICEKFALNT